MMVQSRAFRWRMVRHLLLLPVFVGAESLVVTASSLAESPSLFLAESIAPPPLAASSSLVTAQISAEREGQGLFQSGDYGAAISAWQMASQTYAMQQDLLGQARTLGRMALAQQHQGDWGGARVALSTSWALLSGLEGVAADETRGQVLSARASLHFNLGDRTAALKDWQAAAQHYQSANHPLGQWQSQLAIAQVQVSLGQRDAALTTLVGMNESLDRASDHRADANGPSSALRSKEATRKNFVPKASAIKDSDPGGAASASSSFPNSFRALHVLARRQWADVLRQQGQWQAAQTELRQALALVEGWDDARHQALSEPSLEASSEPASELSRETVLGHLWLSLGHAAREQAQHQQTSPASAEAFYEKAAGISDTEIPAQLALMTLWNDTNTSHNKLRSAWTNVQKQLSAEPPQRRHLYSRIQLLYQLEHAPQPEKLESLAYETVHQAYALADSQAIAQALGALAHVYGHQQQWDKAKSLTQEAIELAQASEMPLLLARLQGQLGHLLWQQYQAQTQEQTQEQSDQPAAQRQTQTAAIAAYQIAQQTADQALAALSSKATSEGTALASVTPGSVAPASVVPVSRPQHPEQVLAQDLQGAYESMAELLATMSRSPHSLSIAQQRKLTQHRDRLQTLELQSLAQQMDSDALDTFVGLTVWSE